MPGQNLQRMWRGILKQSLPLAALVLVTLSLGLAAGALSSNHLEYAKTTELVNHLDNFLGQAANLDIDSARAAKGAMLDKLALIAVLYVLGLTIIGIPVTLGLLFAKGFTLGFAIGFLSSQRAAGGLLLVLVSILPQNLFYLPALLVGVLSSLTFSILLLRKYFNANVKLIPAFIGYSSIMALVLAVTMGSVLVEAYFTPWLTRIAAGFFMPL